MPVDICHLANYPVIMNNEKVDFVAATMHELKTYLTAIIASAELLADELQPYKKRPQGRLIQGIIRSAHSMDERLSLLSEIARLRDGDSQFHPENVDIKQFIHSVAAQLDPLVQSKRQFLALELPDFLPLVRGDRQYLEQILLNLLTNASNFTPEGVQIKVSARQDNDSLVVQVSDTGDGIPVEEQERIFQPYYQINRDEGRNHTGSGLGLAIAKFLVELHGGRIWLDSKVGQGSTFSFSLPGVVS